MPWNDVGLRYATDKATVGPRAGLGHGYLDAYERVLDARKPRSVLEIGVQSGGSLRLWATLFPWAEAIVGIDTDPACAELDLGRAEVVIGDAGDPDRLPVWLLTRTFDLIIDDGSHLLAHTAANMDVWAPRLAPGGVYVVEDAVIGSTSWPQSLNDVLDLLLAHGLTPLAVERGQMEWVAHQHYGGMMAVVFADAVCAVPQ